MCLENGDGEAKVRVQLLCGPVSWAGLCGQTVLLTPTSCLSHVCHGSQGGLESVEGCPDSAFPPGVSWGLFPDSGGRGVRLCGWRASRLHMEQLQRSI